ncbi:MAG TPA: UDP-N-acetylmuramate dehydrogenase [Stellaceae bacterium]|jgi:UDP-N-acetylmuramate dehydrogenase|nr:UDP-N-acetylmuramate dehydrogenase [Stellaceae bacterium]
MMAAPAKHHLIHRLPRVRGRITADAPIGHLTWFRVGGPAEVLFRPADTQDLTDFLSAKPADVPVTVLGVGSNLLMRDGGVPGVVIRLGAHFADIAIKDDVIYTGTGALDGTVALTAAAASLGGLEFLSGIPGTIGGALRMNAGAYGAEIKDALLAVTAIDGSGRHIEITGADLGMSYRHCEAPEDWIFLHAVLQGRPEAGAVIATRMAEIQSQRSTTQPVKSRTGGSTFANPMGQTLADGSPAPKAWELIDRVGGRGLKRGGAMVSELHTNFLINTGEATAADLEGLGEEVRRRVFEQFGVTLHWEIRRIGQPVASLKEAHR